MFAVDTNMLVYAADPRAPGTVAPMREHGVHEIYTADGDLLQFRDLGVVNPLAA